MKTLLRVTLVLGVLGLSTTALGRAGGGQDFSSGSDDDSSGSSDTSYSGSWNDHDDSYSSSSSSGTSGQIGCGSLCMLFTVVVFVLALSANQRKKAGRETARAIDQRQSERLASRRQPVDQMQRALSGLLERDPNFSTEAFLRAAERAFLAVQDAWAARDLNPARRFMSDGVLRRFTVQLALNELHGKRNVTTGTRVLAKTVIAAEKDDDFDTLHVAFQAALRDLDVPNDTPTTEALRQASMVRETRFTEVWSFVRRIGSNAKTGLLAEGKCPSCGAPAEQAPNATCGYCNAILNSGSHDWVLAEITQESEWRLRHPSPDGFARLKAKDPAANVQVLEDRASLVFWKWLETRATGEPKRFARLCSPQTFGELRALEGKPDRSLSRAAVGGVELWKLSSDADYDRAHLLVRWSTGGASSLAHTSVLTLARKAGLVTHRACGMSTDRCHRCSAVQTVLEAVECDHCGVVLSQDWAFEDLASLEAYRARQTQDDPVTRSLDELTGGIAEPHERRRVLALMVAVARADGTVSRSERRLLEGCAQRWSIEPAVLQGLLIAPSEEMTPLAPGSMDEARIVLNALVGAALVDGKVDPAEKKLLESIASHLKLSPGEVSAALAEALRGAPSRPRAGACRSYAPAGDRSRRPPLEATARAALQIG